MKAGPVIDEGMGASSWIDGDVVVCGGMLPRSCTLCNIIWTAL